MAEPITATLDWSNLPDLSRDALVDLGGWAVFKEARALVEAGAVLSASWTPPVLAGEVRGAPRNFHPQLNLRSLAFAENRCSCLNGRRGYVCAHSVALCIVAERKRRADELNPPEGPQNTATQEQNAMPGNGVSQVPTHPLPQSFKVSFQDGKPLFLRFLLPPNLASAAARDVVMVKLELAVGRELQAPEKLFRGSTYKMDTAHAAAAALIEQWCGGKLFSLLQLRCNQLRELLAVMRSQPVFAWVNQQDRPIPWNGTELEGVSDCLPVEAKPGAESAEAGAPAERTTVRRQAVAASPVRESAVEVFKRERALLGSGPVPAEIDGSSQFLSVRLPARAHESYQDVLNVLKDNEFRLEPGNGRWWLRDKHKVLMFLARHLNRLLEVHKVTKTVNFTERTRAIATLPVVIATTPASGGFEVRLQLDVPGIPEQEVFRAITSNQLYLEQGERIYLLQEEALHRLQTVQRALSGDCSRTLSPRFQCTLKPESLRDAERLLGTLDPGFQPPAEWRKRSLALQQVGALQPAPVAAALDDLLRTYQRIGVAWMWHLATHGLGGVLADEMGLGKTIQALALLSARQVAGQHGTQSGLALVVCPAGLVENWRREAARFTPKMRVAIHHREQRIEQVEDFARADLIITSYATLTRDDALFGAVEWGIIIADEAQHIKNRRTQAAASLRSLRAQSRFVLTGTPLENSLDDLRSLFDFILPGYLARLRSGSRDEREWLDQRHLEQAAPYILRRSKESVAPELPAKLEQVVYCPMTPAQAKLYRGVQEQTEAAIAKLELSGAAEQQVRFAALAQLMRLRQVCAEPRLLAKHLDATDSAKLNVLAELLNEAMDGGHRMLVFSQFVEVLSFLRIWLEQQGIAYSYIDGGTRNRVAEAERFNNNPGIPVFLISLKAGGTGLNLTGANMVVHFDPWWNPAAEAQATDRAHRIGQQKQVQVYKLIASDSVEEKVLQLQADKAALLEQLLDASATRTATVSLAQIKDLLR